MFSRFPSIFAVLMLASASASPLPVSEDRIRAKGSATTEWIAGGENAIRVRFDDPSPESGLRLLPPQGRKFWDLSSGDILSADIENLSPRHQLRITLHVTSGDWREKTEKKVDSGIALNPGEKRTLNLRIPHPSTHGKPPGIPGPKTVESHEIHSIDFYMTWPFEGKRPGFVDFKVSNLRLTGTPGQPLFPDNFFPFIDSYGQYIHQDWPHKIHNDEELREAHARELSELRASQRPASWNRFGGWTGGPQLEATGHFRTARHDGKWHLVDPAGRLFFSHGIDVLRHQTDPTPAKDREKWFSFPVTGREIPFNHLNLRKKYGKSDYTPDFYQTLSRRLEHWGINTIGCWGHHDLIALGQTPYTLQLSDYYDGSLPRITGSKLKFYDVFHPAYIQAMKNLVESSAKKNPAIARSLTDPMCIGYFIDNELDYGNRGRITLVDDILRSPATQPAKLELLRDLKAKYSTIENLNTAWQTTHAGWEALLASTEVPKTDGYKTDASIFFLKAVDQYFRLCRDAIKSAAPHRLYLGSRFISTDAIRKPLYDASHKYCDILTVNIYAPGAANFGVDGFPDMPVLIGEFHLGVRDRGMFSASSVPTGISQQERALAYTRFLQGALVHPNIVGAHWFQFRDQPLTGRWDGEGYPIGFVDVADTPYPELIRASREVGQDMYPYRQRGKLILPME